MSVEELQLKIDRLTAERQDLRTAGVERALLEENRVELVKAQKGAIHAPKSVDFVDAIPLSALGKPDKKALRAQYWAGSGRQVG